MLDPEIEQQIARQRINEHYFRRIYISRRIDETTLNIIC